MIKIQTRRSVVTPEDRRAVLMQAMGRKSHEVARMNNENFIRRALKERLGVPQQEQASAELKKAARDLAAVVVQREKEAAEARAARVAAAAAKESA